MTTYYGTGGNPTDGTPTDPDEIRRGIEQTQARVSSTVDALAGKMTPGRVVDRRVARVRGTAAEHAARLRGTARRQAQGNPLVAGVIAFGAGWLVSSLLPATRHEPGTGPSRTRQHH